MGYPGRSSPTSNQGATGGAVTHENHPDYFPELRFHTLETYAHKWGENISLNAVINSAYIVIIFKLTKMRYMQTR